MAFSESMSQWIASGQAIDWIFAGILIEVVLLMAYRAYTGRGVAPRQLLVMTVAGAGLFFALRFALTQPVQAGPIALGMLVSLAAHVLDLRMRWGRQ